MCFTSVFEIMKPRVVFGIITTKWLLAIVLYTHNLFSFTKVAKFGSCVPNDRTHAIPHVLPVFLPCFLTIFLNIYLTIKAYQAHKQIQDESKLSGGHSTDNNRLKALKKEQATIKKHLKPMKTLMVVLGSLPIELLSTLMFISMEFLESPAVYEELMHYVIACTQCKFPLPSLSSICLWTILQTSERTNDEITEEDHLPM